MNQRLLAIVTLGVVVCIGVGAVIWNFAHQSRQLQTASQAPISGTAQAGGTAPEFSVATTAGLFDLAKTDKPVFLEVFATWCPHCQRETAVIDRLYEKYKSQVDFVGVSGSANGIDGSSPSSQLDVVQWKERFNAQYPVAYDPTLGVAKLYLQNGFPTLVVIGKDKKISYIDSGEISYDVLDAAIGKVVAG